MKPRIFIGSSKEGLSVAERIKKFYDSDFECYLWTDDIFKFNENFLETLMKEATLFDFGFLLFTKDDYTTSRMKSFDSPRDNVLFEYGLFLGRLGNTRAFIVQEEGVKIPSDLFGITHATYELNVDGSVKEDSLHSELNRLKKLIDENIKLGILGLLPSTALAIGYFFNFVQAVCDSLSIMNEIELNGTKYNKFKFKIIIPKDLDADMKKRAINYFRKNNFEQYPIQTSGRNYPLFVTMDKSDTSTLTLCDMPTTLNGIDKAIEMYLKKGHIGKSSEQELLEQRELRNFEIVLRNLIETDSFCKEYIVIEKEN